MHGYVAKRRDRYYAVIYEGRDPVTGKERRRWHPAGTDRADGLRLTSRDRIRDFSDRTWQGCWPS